MKYDLVAQSSESTVVAEYNPPQREGAGYQSESELERELIKLLQAQAYEYISITSEAELIANLRAQLEALNSFQFSDNEWQGFFT
ncbi:MAG: hypothetical protein PHO85_04340, partial [Candidatus Cloacimonetes bacterium]|nr:hypothetical protein [Candidatus Cloacimonadota bacterium]